MGSNSAQSRITEQLPCSEMCVFFFTLLFPTSPAQPQLCPQPIRRIILNLPRCLLLIRCPQPGGPKRDAPLEAVLSRTKGRRRWRFGRKWRLKPHGNGRGGALAINTARVAADGSRDRKRVRWEMAGGSAAGGRQRLLRDLDNVSLGRACVARACPGGFVSSLHRSS